MVASTSRASIEPGIVVAGEDVVVLGGTDVDVDVDVVEVVLVV
jgi:hypothetical protein